MTERYFGPRIPEKLLAEAKQQFKETLLKNEIIVTAFSGLLAESNDISIEPFSNTNEYGIYIETRTWLKGWRTGLVIHQAHGYHMPILTKDKEGNFSQYSPAFVRNMRDVGISESSIEEVIQLFEINAEMVWHSALKARLISNPPNFTWQVTYD